MKKHVFNMANLICFIFRQLLNGNKPVVYYNERPNVGDALNEDIIYFYSGKKIENPPGIRFIRHFLCVGSVASAMTHKSIIWGSGLISKEAINNIQALGDIRALRGKLSKYEIEKKFHIELNVPLGDPALLMPRIYPGHTRKSYKFGVVLHYVDESDNINALVESMGGLVIKVSLPVKEFIEEICKCEKIISSSMHGLILADAYNIPNIRFVLSDKIVGGDFKFDDYYSTTDSPNESNNKHVISGFVSNNDIIAALDSAKINRYLYDLNLLENSFPLR